MRTGRPRKPLEISDEDHEQLSMLAGRPTSTQAMALRARIVLGCGQGMSNSEVARYLHITGATVGKWRERFRKFGPDGLLDEPRAGAPRRISDRQIEAVVTRTVKSLPARGTRWSTRLMAEETGLSQNSIVRIWRAFGLQPHRVEKFKSAKDPQFAGQARDIVGLYLNPPDRAIVLCVEEESQAGRQSHDDQLHAATPLFAAMEVAAGVTLGTGHRRHRHRAFLSFLLDVEEALPAGLDVHLVMETHGTHKAAEVRSWLARCPHFHVHSKPPGGSWLNLVERFFVEVTERGLRRGSHSAVRVLERALLEYSEQRNQNPKPFVWTAGTDLIASKV
ncbi:MAG: IS630 family transposase [Acidobacteria bacterium]|nr:IS630 family transposase [Acidobacteriota bacterium]